MTMETDLIADSAIVTPAPALAAESATPVIPQNLKNERDALAIPQSLRNKDLRAKLADAIDARRAADAKAFDADAIAARADAAAADAAALVEGLKAEAEAVQRDAIEAHALDLATAFRAGQTLPEPSTLPEANSAAMVAAVARLNALRAAAQELAGEAAAARNAAADAARACRDIVDAIIAADARALAAEWIAATRLCWALSDQLKGLARLGGDLLPNGYQEDLLNQVDRRRTAIAENPQLIERFKFDAYLNGLVADAESRWTAYGCRLMSDPNTTFGEGLSQ